MEHNNSGLDDAIIECLHLQVFTKRADLRLQLNAKGYYLKDRLLRKHVEQLITDGQYCISSSEKGYSLITTAEDLQKAESYLKKKAYALHERISCLKENFKIGKIQAQLQLFA